MDLMGKTSLRGSIVSLSAVAASAVLVIISLLLFLVSVEESSAHPILCGAVVPAAASVLMTSGVFSVMYEVFVRRRQTEFVLEALQLRESTIEAGLEGLSTNYNQYDYAGQIKLAQDITLFFLYGQTWLGRYLTELSEHVERKGTTLTLCVPSFDNPFFEPLARHFQYTTDELKRRIAEAVTACALLALPHSGAPAGVVRIYLHRSRPSYSMYKFDDRLLVGTYYASSARRRAPMFEFKDRPGSLFNEFAADLDKVINQEAELIFDSKDGMDRIEETLRGFVPDSFRRAVERRVATPPGNAPSANG